MRINDLLRVSGTALAIAIWPCLGIPATALGGPLQTAEEERTDSATPDTSSISLRDDFESELTLKWEPVRPDASHVSLDKHPGICLDLRPGAPVPKELATRQGDRRLLITLRRPEAND